MRAALLIAALAACSGKATPRSLSSGPVVAAEYSASRWIPARPAYAVAARTVRDAQRSARDVIEAFGPLVDAGTDAAAVSALSERMLAVDALSSEAVAAIGVDVDGGLAVFSEGVSPTFVVHLASPAQFAGFVATQQNLRTQSVVVEGTEVFTASLGGGIRLSWAVADNWLWVHFGLPIGSDDATWFTSSRRPGAQAWAEHWNWAKNSGGAGRTPPIVGFVDLRGIVAGISARVPSAAACAQLLEPVGHAGFALDGDATRADGTLAVELGGSAQGVVKALVPGPEGWAAVAAKAPIAVQWNIDLAMFRAWADPCVKMMDVDLQRFERLGIRTARALLVSFDADDKFGTGVAALDLFHKKFFASQLDQIPARSLIERKRMFGPYSGRSLSIPLGPTVDYVLTDQLALAGAGDGMLASVVGAGKLAAGPVVSIDVRPPGLTKESWEGLLWLLDIDNPKRVTERMLKWRSANISATVDGSRLVVAASAVRR